MLKEGQLVSHNNVTLLARVIKPDPDDHRKVIIKPITGEKPFSCSHKNLTLLG